MLDDLKKDTSVFNTRIDQGQDGLKSCDTLLTLLRPKVKNDRTAAMYYHARMVSLKSPFFEIFDRTYSQMKSSGNLRLLHSREVADSITSYYFSVADIHSQTSYIHELVLEYFKNASVVFDGSVFQKMWYDAGFTSIGAPDFKQNLLKPPQGNPPLADTSKSSVTVLVNSIHFLYSRIFVTRTQIIRQNEKAIRLIKYLQKEYKLKE
jgi:hypothetical protein